MARPPKRSPHRDGVDVVARVADLFSTSVLCGFDLKGQVSICIATTGMKFYRHCIIVKKRNVQLTLD